MFWTAAPEAPLPKLSSLAIRTAWRCGSLPSGYALVSTATTLDLQHPEVLVYEKMPDGTFQLNGVEFLVPISAWKSSEPPRIMGQALIKADSIGLYFLHVWTWKPSPKGLFSMWNPDVKCIDGSSMNH